ncbi:hypothetical protein LCGC14_1108280 [marine sediment metagenome]|uniref:Uncharacterized protein n=1 Tax=marine sediment metagenome TaxID=412755 RepID=A0A0F9M7K6_9ZZZZ
MKLITGGLTAVIVPTSTAVSHSGRGKNYGTWIYRRLSDPHGNRSYWHPVFKSSGYHGEKVPKNWVKFSDEMVSPEEWYEFMRKYQSVRKVINSSEVVKDDELKEKDVSDLLHTLYRVSRYLRYHGVGNYLIHSAVKELKYKNGETY